MGRSRLGPWPLVLLTACGGGPTAPLAFCPSGTPPTMLLPHQYAAVNPAATGGCLVFPANASATDTAEYVLVPQATTQTPDLSSAFKLVGSAGTAGAPAVAASVQGMPLSPAEWFHNRLRELERSRAYGPAAAGAPGALSPTRVAPSTPITVGDTGHFKVLNTITGLTTNNVTAVAQSVGQHIAIFIDTAAPSPGLTSFDLDTLRDIFDARLYAADTAAFGRESDIDSNHVVIVLLTNTVNKMVTASQCTATGYVAGFFFGGDIDPVFRSQFNSAEIFYAIVPDPAGTLSCVHTVANVKGLVPPTFVHEFQHMISYNQHVLLRGGQAEVLWLNEGMSHYAEELGGRTFLPNDSVSFCHYVQSDLANADQYFQSPGSYPLVDTSGIGGIPERGEWWSFVRYLVDQFAGDTSLAAVNTFTRKIDQTGLLGTANLAQQTGRTFETLAERWALANWVSDVPNFVAPPELQYKRWAFRSDYPALHNLCSGIPGAFFLTALASAPTSVNVSGTIRSGSAAAYQRVLQAPGGSGFRLLFTDASGAQLPISLAPRLNVIRIR